MVSTRAEMLHIKIAWSLLRVHKVMRSYLSMSSWVKLARYPSVSGLGVTELWMNLCLGQVKEVLKSSNT